jgi:DNA processing protein
MHDASDNAKAILLLTAPLSLGDTAESRKILSLTDYNSFARFLHALGLQPQDLLAPDLTPILPKLPSWLDGARLNSLLNRSFALAQALSEWRKRSIWVLSRADPSYPSRLKSKLREHAPSILYGCGDPALLEIGGLAVIGSRTPSEESKTYAEQLGALAANANVPIVSGAAQGINSCAMAGAQMNGGTVVGIMSDNLERAALLKANRDALQEGRLVLVCAYDPSADFTVDHAMARNKAIYAIADVGLVITSDLHKGETWAGAVEQLEKLQFNPLFVRQAPDCGPGNASLLQRGGKRWPEPQHGEDLIATMRDAALPDSKTARADQLGLHVMQETPARGPNDRLGAEAILTTNKHSSLPAKDRLMEAVSLILCEELIEPKDAEQVAEALHISKSQVSVWLKELVTKGVIEKLSEPVRFQTIKKAAGLL